MSPVKATATQVFIKVYKATNWKGEHIFGYGLIELPSGSLPPQPSLIAKLFIRLYRPFSSLSYEYYTLQG